MFLYELQKIIICLHQHDFIEMSFCVIITHALLHTIYSTHGTRWYTISYCTALCIVTTWILSYKVTGSVIFMAAITQTLLRMLESHHYVPAPTTATAPEPTNWIETMVSLSIQAFHEDISLTWIIDCEEQLHTFLRAEITLNVYIVPKLSTIIFNTIDTTTKTSVLWVNRYGYIIGINPTSLKLRRAGPTSSLLHRTIHNSAPNSEGTVQETPTLSDITTWSKQNGIIMLQSYSQKRMYAVVHKGIVRDNLSSHHAYHIIKQILTPQPVIRTQELT